MSFSKVRSLLTRAAAAGGTVAVGVVAFPHAEDHYWLQKDPARVWDSKESILPANKLGVRKSDKQELVILGTGWASISVLQHIDRDKYNITVVSPRNYFLFTPLLPSVCAGTISPEAVTIPIRDISSYKAMSIFDRIGFMWRGYLPDRILYVYAAASDIDPVNKTVSCEYQSATIRGSSEGFTLPFDVLVLGTGATTNTFNTEGVHEYCHYIKETGDALLIRQAVLENLEKASLPGTSDEERRKLLSFLVIGGGPTAVEFAAELQDFLQHDVVNPKHAQYNRCAGTTAVTLVQSNQDLLPGYPQEIRDFTLDHLQDIGIKVWTEARATKITEGAISIYDKKAKATTELPYGLVVWATGVAPGELAKRLISKLPEQVSYRSLKVDSRCEVIGGPGIFAVGDCADVDVQSEYTKKILDLYNRFDSEFPGGSESKLSLEANEAVLKELELGIRGIVTAPGAKIVKELYTRFEATRDHYLQNGGAFQGLTKEEAHDIVQTHMDRQKHLPPTAQVANQQGEYLAQMLNNPEINSDGKWTFDHAEGFKFKNLGQLVYVGGHMAALSVPASDKVDVSWNGALTNYLWHAAYFGMLQSMSARWELVFDWTKSSIFGRSTALNAICTTDSASHVEALRRGGGVSRKCEACTTSSSSSKGQVCEKTRWRRWFSSNSPEAVKKNGKVVTATQE